MSKFAVAVAFSALVSAFAVAQTTTPVASTPSREVHGQTIISKELPAAELTFGGDYRYIGGQTLNLYGNANAEQHLFVKAKSSGAVGRFYWIQFEYFLPTISGTYDYQPDRTTDIGGLQFIYDVKSWSDYAGMQTEDPVSDGAAVERLLAQHDLAFPKKTARVRMFYLPTPDRRTELMIIYGEALPEGSSVPVRKEGVVLDKDAPELARVILEDARRDLTIRQR